MKKYLISIIPILLFIPIITLACPDPNNPDCANAEGKGQTTGPTTIIDPLNGAIKNDPNLLIGMVLKSILGLVGSIALAMFILGGLTWMTAAESNEKITKGKNIIVWATGINNPLYAVCQS